MIYRIYSNLIFWTAYGLSWLFWQAGGKQIRRGFLRSYDDIDEADAARTLESTPLPDPQDDVVDLGEEDLFVVGHPSENPMSPQMRKEIHDLHAGRAYHSGGPE